MSKTIHDIEYIQRMMPAIRDIAERMVRAGGNPKYCLRLLEMMERREGSDEEVMEMVYLATNEAKNVSSGILEEN